MEYGFGHILIRFPYTPYSIYFRGTIGSGAEGLAFLSASFPSAQIPGFSARAGSGLELGMLTDM